MRLVDQLILEFGADVISVDETGKNIFANGVSLFIQKYGESIGIYEKLEKAGQDWLYSKVAEDVNAIMSSTKIVVKKVEEVVVGKAPKVEEALTEEEKAIIDNIDVEEN
jgi:hypothetical protein